MELMLSNHDMYFSHILLRCILYTHVLVIAYGWLWVVQTRYCLGPWVGI